MFAKRYFKLVPLYFLIVWFKKSLWSQLGPGPFWDHGFNNRTLVWACYHQESWFASLTYQNVFRDIMLRCRPQAWYLANEVFFIVYLIPIASLLITRPKVALIAGVVAMFYSIYTIQPRFVNSFQEFRGYLPSAFLWDYSYLHEAPYNQVDTCCTNLRMRTQD